MTDTTELLTPINVRHQNNLYGKEIRELRSLKIQSEQIMEEQKKIQEKYKNENGEKFLNLNELDYKNIEIEKLNEEIEELKREKTLYKTLFNSSLVIGIVGLLKYGYNKFY